MRSSIINRLFASGGRIWRAKSSVCGSGRRVIGSSPWLMLPPSRGSSGGLELNFYKVAEQIRVSLEGGFPYDSLRFVGSSHGWLALLNDRTNALFLTNPVSGRRINLPPTPTNSVSVSRVVLSCSPDDDEGACRAVLSFVPEVVHVDDYNGYKSNSAEIFAHFLSAMSLGPPQTLAFCCLNDSKNAWTPISDFDCYKSYGDFVYSGKNANLFCLTTDNHVRNSRPNLSDVEVWDLSDPECPRMERRHSLTDMPQLSRDSSGVSERRYLVHSEQADQLYLVRRHMMERVQVRGRNTGKFAKDIYFHNRGGWDNSYPYKTVGFDVHRIDHEHGKLLMDDEVSLDNVAIFIGINNGLVMEAADQFGLSPNSIYFTDDTIHTPPNIRDADEKNGYWRVFVDEKWASKWADLSSVYGGHDIGIFDCKNKTISPCFYPIDAPSLKRIDPPPLWFTPQE